ncbi:uncharacterized protein LOC131680457 [Topomyia yanbarensis]|uniref:uncharacterized protein LOC131680457 n=1 Tax=Topomyia yanbarensis TaxID=2498891 RepID=UPI00273A92B5|nr:uncharacterized protein LOC131680457 [Topomyia yanbarensis]
MDPRCRICLELIPGKWISLISQQGRILKMMEVLIGEKLDCTDGLPEHICSKCSSRLDQTYELWQQYSASNAQQKFSMEHEEIDLHCRICLNEEVEELYPLNCICDTWKLPIIDMLRFLGEVRVETEDYQLSYICDVCLNHLDVGCGLKRQCLDSEATLRQQTARAWEKMEVRMDDLAVELYAEAILHTIKPGKTIEFVSCSICQLRMQPHQFVNKCDGCLLVFENFVEIIDAIDRGNRKKLKAKNKPIQENGHGSREKLKSKSKLIFCKKPTKKVAAVSYDTDAGTNEDQGLTSKGTKFVPCQMKTQIDKLYELFDVVENNHSLYQKVCRKGPICCRCNKFFLTEEDIIEHRLYFA